MSTKKPVIANAHKLKVEAEAAKILRNGIKELMGLGIDDEVVDEGDKATLRS
jgi:DNA-binding protein YbaB